MAYSRNGEQDRALEDFHKVIEMNPKAEYAYNNRGYTFQIKGDLALAMADYNRAIEINPQLTLAYINRGNTFKAKGEQGNACADWQRACDLGACAAYQQAQKTHYCD